MKKYFSLLAACLLVGSTQLSAQTVNRPQSSAGVANEAIQQGNWVVGATVGRLGFNFKSDNFNIDINPRAAYFVSDNAAIGAEVQLGLDAYQGGETFRYGVTPFVRYYFPEGATPTNRWFGEARAGVGGSSMKDSEGDSPIASVLGLNAGYSHFVAQNVALEGVLGYTRSRADIYTGLNSSGLSLGIGLQIYLPGRNR